jgi:hypothetical protein
MKSYENFVKEGIKHWFRKNDYVLNGFIGETINLRITGTDHTELKTITENPTYARSLKDGFYGNFGIYFHFNNDNGLKIDDDIDPLGEENWNDEEIENLIIRNAQTTKKMVYNYPGSFDWDNVPYHISLTFGDEDIPLQTDKAGVELIGRLIKAIADKEIWTDGDSKGFTPLLHYYIEELERGDSIFNI